jgi:oligopeptide transport system ATP-binding protein
VTTDKRLLSVDGLTVEFVTDDGRFKAVDEVSFRIDAGETVVLVGESGSGKSVTSLAILRLILTASARIAARSIRFRQKDGRIVDLSTAPEAEMRRIRGNEIAMIFQEPMTSLNPVFNIGKQIAEAIVVHQGKTRKDAWTRAWELLSGLGISDPERRLWSYPHQLSGGMRQRVMIAMALACRPELLIADEPTTALDVTIQAQILELIRRLQDEMGMAVLFITHNLGVAAEIADRIIVMYAGRTVEEGPTEAVFRRPRMPYTRGLLHSVPRLGAARDPDFELQSMAGNIPDAMDLPAGCAFHPRCPGFVRGRCDVRVPPYESCGPDCWVRCVRWRELAEDLPGSNVGTGRA